VKTQGRTEQYPEGAVRPGELLKRSAGETAEWLRRSAMRSKLQGQTNLKMAAGCRKAIRGSVSDRYPRLQVICWGACARNALWIEKEAIKRGQR